MLKRHLENLLTYLRHRITNAVTEGIEFEDPGHQIGGPGLSRNFRNYRIRILFFCGKLNLSTHYDPRRNEDYAFARGFYLPILRSFWRIGDVRP